jgi:hypothetical protein
MELQTSDKVREALRGIPRAEWDALAIDSGVPRSTIEKIAYGVTANPSFDSMVGIVEALKRRESRAAA